MEDLRRKTASKLKLKMNELADLTTTTTRVGLTSCQKLKMLVNFTLLGSPWTEREVASKELADEEGQELTQTKQLNKMKAQWPLIEEQGQLKQIMMKLEQ